MYGYHITAAQNLESIMAQGLVRDADGWDAGYVWFFDTLEAAQEMLPKWSARNACVILKLDLEGIDVLPDPHCADGRNGEWYEQHARVTTRNLEAHRLSVAS